VGVLSQQPHTRAKLILTLCAALSALAWGAAAATGATFDRRPLPLASDKLFDMGVVDFDLDGDLDSFTLNHKFSQTLLANDGSGGWTDVFHQVELQSSPPFPGLEDVRHRPATDEDGAYFYFTPHGFAAGEGEVLLHIDNASASRVLNGELEALTPIDVRRTTGATAEVVELPGDPPRVRLDFRVEPGGSLIARPGVTSAPLTARVDSAFPSDSVFVGSEAVNPASQEFSFRLTDRHGMAWGDLDSDGDVDVFISTGGGKGQISRFPSAFADELRLRDGPSFDLSTAGSGLDKGVCRGRSTSTIDFDGDGALDLLESCEDSDPRLWAGQGDGSFTDASHLLAGARAQGEILRWSDLNGDSRPDLVAAGPGRLALVAQLQDGFATRRVFKVRGRPTGVAIADWDGSRTPDVLATFSGETVLVRERAGSFERIAGERLGLPRRGARSAAWVDYDNDGRLDAHLAPQGLFRQRRRGGFVRTELAGAPPATTRAVTSWADLNGDGARDLLQFLRTDSRPRAYTMINRGPSGSWLEVDLVGLPENAQAVGAAVTVRSGNRTQTQWVGQSETSRYSQGHYRVYYGLGRRSKPVAVRVSWPDGATTRVDDVAVDDLITLSRE
jgi:hypothetical protein